MGILEGTLAALEHVKSPEEAEVHMAWYVGKDLFLEVNAQDGFYQEHYGQSFQPKGGGLELVLAQVERVGAEQWSYGIEGYLEFEPEDEPVQRVYLTGIQWGYIIPPDGLEHLLSDALHGHGLDRLRDELEDVGVKQL